MDNLIEQIQEYVISKSEEYKSNAVDKYDYWNEHIKYVYKEAIELAKKYNADITIVKLGALLHDIALIERVGERRDHHINGKLLSDKILDTYNCPSDIKEKVLGCVYNHRSSKNATNIEELCVCDADILAHFDNLPMIFSHVFKENMNLNDIRKKIKESFEKDYNDLSDRTKEDFKDRYNLINNIIINE